MEGINDIITKDEIGTNIKIVKACTNFDLLCEFLKSCKYIPGTEAGSKGYTPEYVIKQIQDVRNGQSAIDFIPRAYGLRAKVYELLQASKQNIQPERVNYLKARHLAEELYNKFELALKEYFKETKNREPRVDEQGNILQRGQGSIRKALVKFPQETLSRYVGHGVTRGSMLEQLAAAISILANEAIRGDTSKLRESGAIDAYTGGTFLVLSHRDKPLILMGPDNERIMLDLGQDTRGQKIAVAKVDMGALVVNDYFEPIIGELRRMFPNRKILSAKELEDYIQPKESSAR